MEGDIHLLESLQYINRHAQAVAFGRADGHGNISSCASRHGYVLVCWSAGIAPYILNLGRYMEVSGQLHTSWTPVVQSRVSLERFGEDKHLWILLVNELDSLDFMRL
jgi:hypothetical protein